MSQSKSTANGITEGVIWKQLLSFFFPILLGSFLQQLYNTVDAVIVGQFVGKEALAAVGGSTNYLISLLVTFFVGLSSGATVIISQFFGAKKPEETSQAVHTAAAVALSGGALFMAVGLIISPFALEALGTPEDVMPHALIYMQIYFAGMIFNFTYNIGAGVLRAVGDSRNPLYFLIVCVVVNLILDLLFVAVLDMGVMGAALATILAQAISAALVVRSLMRTTDIYHLYPRKIRFHKSIFFDIIKIGFPAGLQSVMYNVSNLVVQACVNGFGTDIMASWTAFSKVDAMFYVVMGAYGVAVTTFSGQNFGAAKYHRIR